MGSPYRVNRVRESLLREVSVVIKNLKDPRIGTMNVVDVDLSRDLKYAKVFVSMIGTESDRSDAMRVLSKARGFIRKEVAERLQLRFAPEIKIMYDDSAERAARMSSLLHQAGHGEQE